MEEKHNSISVLSIVEAAMDHYGLNKATLAKNAGTRDQNLYQVFNQRRSMGERMFKLLMSKGLHFVNMNITFEGNDMIVRFERENNSV